MHRDLALVIVSDCQADSHNRLGGWFACSQRTFYRVLQGLELPALVRTSHNTDAWLGVRTQAYQVSAGVRCTHRSHLVTRRKEKVDGRLPNGELGRPCT